MRQFHGDLHPCELRLHEYRAAESAFACARPDHRSGREGPMMPAKLNYHWNLRRIMADLGMFQTTDLIEPLDKRGITLSSSQVYRLVVERPERLSLKILMALLDILDCSMSE